MKLLAAILLLSGGGLCNGQPISVGQADDAGQSETIVVQSGNTVTLRDLPDASSGSLSDREYTIVVEPRRRGLYIDEAQSSGDTNYSLNVCDACASSAGCFTK